MNDLTGGAGMSAFNGFSGALRTLAGTAMRVARGTGEPARIGPQLQDVVEARLAFRDVIGRYPRADEIVKVLSVYRDVGEFEGETLRERIFMERIVCNALQVAASRLLGQVSQEQRAEMDIMLSVRSRMDYLNERRRGR